MSAIEKKLGLGNGTIGKWGKNGRVPNYANLCAVADALGVTVSELTGSEAIKKDITPQGDVDARDMEFSELLSKLTDAEKDIILAQLRGLAQGR